MDFGFEVALELFVGLERGEIVVAGRRAKIGPLEAIDFGVVHAALAAGPSTVLGTGGAAAIGRLQHREAERVADPADGELGTNQRRVRSVEALKSSRAEMPCEADGGGAAGSQAPIEAGAWGPTGAESGGTKIWIGDRRGV